MKKRKLQNRVRERLADTLDVSKEIILDTALIRVIGDKEMTIENYKGIIEYSDKVIRVKTKPEIIKVYGEKLDLSNISDETICVSGKIKGILFCDGQEDNV